MIGLRKSPAATAPELDEQTAAPLDGRKGHPTPKRRDQQAARRQPLVPVDRKAAKSTSRDEQRKSRVIQREAMARGDESALLPRDRGPVKRYIRNYVDARLRVGEIMLPLMLIMLLASVALPNALKTNGLLIVWFIFLAGVLDSAWMWRGCKKRIIQLTGAQPPARSWWYAGMRAFQMRFTRMPKPQVSRGTRLDDLPAPGRTSSATTIR